MKHQSNGYHPKGGIRKDPPRPPLGAPSIFDDTSDDLRRVLKLARWAITAGATTGNWLDVQDGLLHLERAVEIAKEM